MANHGPFCKRIKNDKENILKSIMWKRQRNIKWCVFKVPQYICSRDRYITHFYCLAVEAGFYSDVVECLPLDPAAQVRFPPRAVGIFLHPVTFGGQCGGPQLVFRASLSMKCPGITAWFRVDSGTNRFKAGKYVVGIGI